MARAAHAPRGRRRQLLERSTGRAHDAATVSLGRAIRTRTAGNPLFARELIGDLLDRPAADEALPDGLVEIIGRRTARLGDDAVLVLRIAAAVGQRFPVDVVEAVAGEDGGAPVDVLAALERAAAAGLVVDDEDNMSFRHAVIRGALVERMVAARAQRLHRTIAAVLERRWAADVDDHLATLAYHHDRARSPDAPQWYLRAAWAAVAALDPGAEELADRGLALLGPEHDDRILRCDLLIARAAGLRLAERETIADVRRAGAAAVALADPDRIAGALLCLSPRRIHEEADEHLQLLADGVAHLTGTHGLARWRLAAELSIRRLMVLASTDREHRREVLEVVGHLVPEDEAACRLALRCARSLVAAHDAPVAAPIVARFAPGCGGVDSDGLPVELAIATMGLHLGDRAMVDRHLGLARADARRRNPSYDSQVRQRDIARLLLDGQWGAAATGLDEVRRRWPDDVAIQLGCQAQQAWLERETGEVETCYERTTRLTAERTGDVLRAARVASDAAEAGHHDVARAELARLAANGSVNAPGSWMTVMAFGHLAWAAVTVGDHEHAAPLRERLAPYAGQLAVMGTGLYVLAAVDRLLAGLAALAGDHDEAEAGFARALAQEQALGPGPLPARTLHWWARARLGRGEVETARPLLAEARTSANCTGLKGLLAQLDALALSD